MYDVFKDLYFLEQGLRSDVLGQGVTTEKSRVEGSTNVWRNNLLKERPFPAVSLQRGGPRDTGPRDTAPGTQGVWVGVPWPPGNGVSLTLAHKAPSSCPLPLTGESLSWVLTSRQHPIPADPHISVKVEGTSTKLIAGILANQIRDRPCSWGGTAKVGGALGWTLPARGCLGSDRHTRGGLSVSSHPTRRPSLLTGTPAHSPALQTTLH